MNPQMTDKYSDDKNDGRKKGSHKRHGHASASTAKSRKPKLN